MKMSSVIFREYDIRGVYDEEFDDSFAYELGKAYTSFVSNKTGKLNHTFVIGHDARKSCPGLVDNLSKGMEDSGAKVLHIGLVTTPMTYFTTFQLEIDGAIMITGSHNPSNYNGFKISVGPSTISGEDIQKLYQLIQNKDYIEGSGSRENYDIFPEYIERYKDEFRNLKNIPIVIDCGNGAAGSVVRKLYEAVGLTPIILFEEPDGSFPNHHPDPTVEENMVDLKAAVLKHNAAIGIGFDGDADRIGIIDNEGNFLYGDEIMCLISRNILSANPGEHIIADVKCSDRLYKDIENKGGIPVMWKTGHSLIKNKIKEVGTAFGGEYSGHVFFNDRNYGYDDAPYAGLRIVEMISTSGKSVREQLEGWPKAFNTPEIRIDTTEEKKFSIVEKVKEHFSKSNGNFKVNDIDGIRVSFEDGWALARASNTQPVLSLRYEADSEEGLNRIRNEFEKIIDPLL